MRTQPRDPDTVRRAAHAIVSQAQFRLPTRSPIDRARSWVGRQIANVLDRVLTGHLGVLGAVVLAAIVTLIVWGVVRAGRGVRLAQPGSGPAVTGARRTPADWLAEAGACEARGDWRGALRARYRAMLAELARRGLVDEIPGRTTGEYRAEVAASLPRAVGEFGGATDLFERAVYGHGDTGPGEASQLQALADRVLAGAR